MRNSKSILILALFFVQGCSDKNPHVGLYNALFVNYDKRLASLDQNLTTEKNNESKLQNKYQVITQNTNQKESTLHKYEEENSLLQIEQDNASLELNEVVSFDKKDRDKPIKIRKIINKMNNVTMKIINKEPEK